MPNIEQLRRKYSDWLLTAMAALLALMIFVFAPLQASGIYALQGFAIAGLLVIIGGVTILSASPIALALMCVALLPIFRCSCCASIILGRTTCICWLPHG